jgi:hypothetical protein
VCKFNARQNVLCRGLGLKARIRIAWMGSPDPVSHQWRLVTGLLTWMRLVWLSFSFANGLKSFQRID